MMPHRDHVRTPDQSPPRDDSALLQADIYKTFIDTAPVAIAMFDRDMVYLAASSRWMKDYALGDGDIVGRSHYDIFPEIPELWKAVHRRGLAGEVVKAEEDRFQRRDGTIQWLRWEVRPWYDQGGAVGGIIIYSEDITERKQIEERLRILIHQAEEAAAMASGANAAKSRFMAAASHDLRQPLVPIKLFAELLAEDLGETPPGVLARKLNGAVQSLDDLLNKMLAFSHLEAGVVACRTETVCLGDVIRRFQREFSPVAAAKGLVLHAVTTSVAVRTDRVLLELMLRNLLENAIRYTQSGKVLIGCRHWGGLVRLCVLDSGIGIPVEQQDAIFTDFYQAGTPTSRPEGGLGLGLATVRRLSKVLDVPVSVRSTSGKGSCFQVTLSRVPEDELTVCQPSRPPLPDPGPLRILLIEDDRKVQEGLVAVLVRRGWEPTVVTSLSEVVETVRTQGVPDAVVTDLRLSPTECGLDAIAAVEVLAGRQVPTIIMTADASHDRLAEAMRSEWPVLIKPFSAEQLYRTIAETVLDGRRASGAA